MNRILFIIMIAMLTSCTKQEVGQPEDEKVDERVSIATEISRQSRLYTSEYVVHKIVTHNDLKQLRGSFLGMQFKQELPLGERKIAIPIDVVLQAYIDLSQIREEDIEIIQNSTFKVQKGKDDTPPLEGKGEVLHITLPDPRIVITSSKVDNEGIRTHVSWLRSDFRDEELTDFAQQGVASVLRTVPRMGIIESARQNAASLLIPLLTDMGYTQERIVVTFRKEFTERDLPHLYDNERSTVKIKG